ELEPDPEPDAEAATMPLPAPAPEPALLTTSPNGGRVAPTAHVRKGPRRDSWSGKAVGRSDSGEPAWAAGAAAIAPEGKDARTVKVAPSVFGDEFSDLEMLRRRQGSRGWVWVVGLILVGGAGGGWLLLRDRSEPAAAATADAGAAVVGPIVTPVAPD